MLLSIAYDKHINHNLSSTNKIRAEQKQKQTKTKITKLVKHDFFKNVDDSKYLRILFSFIFRRKVFNSMQNIVKIVFSLLNAF